MSRQGNVAKLVKAGMQEEDDDDEGYSDEENKNFTEEQWGMIDQLMDMFHMIESETIKVFEEADMNFDKTVELIQLNRVKEKQRQQKLKEKELKKKEKELEKEKQLFIQKQKQLNEIQLKKLKSSQSISRKTSQEMQIGGAIRKNSHIVEEYLKDHYNLQYPPINVNKETEKSTTINIVIVGHVDSGKSTLVGIFLKEASFIDQKEVHKNQKQSKLIGKESFRHAWVTDSTEEERKRGVTIGVGVKKIQLKDRKVVFLDSPGHKDFIPNMITGAAQADYAVLVIDVDNFESSFAGGGQTKEHAYIVKSLGVHKIIVAINKMDRINWNAQRFLIVKNKLNTYLIKIGFKEEQIIFLPLSAINAINITGKNIHKFEADFIVYDKSFLEIISSLDMPLRSMDKPFRMSISNFYDSLGGKLKGHCLSGKIQGGVIRKDQKLLILPQDTQCLIKEILVNGEKVKEGVVGDNVDLQIKLIDQTYFETVKHGNVLSSLKYSIPVTQNIIVEALALDLDRPVLRGTEVVVYIGTNKSLARITKIYFIYNPSDGAIIKKNPKAIKSNECAEIQIETKQKMCVEIFSNFKTFGRIIIRQNKDTLFVGTIKKIN